MKVNIRKIVMVIMSLLASFALWLYVMSMIDVDGRSTVNEVKVNVIGQESLASRGLSVINHTPEITLRFYGRRTDLVKLNKSNVSVEVDVSRFIYAGTYTVPYTNVKLPDDISTGRVTLESASAQIELLIDKMDSKFVSVKVSAGSIITTADGFIKGATLIEPGEIRIDGPTTVLETISHAEISLDEQGLDRTVGRTKDFTLVNSEGIPVEHVNLEEIPTEVFVTIPVNKKKTVALDVEFIDGGGITKDNINYGISPESITVSGDASVLDGLNTIYIGQIDLGKKVVGNEHSDSFIIPLPNGCENISGVNEAVITLEVVGVVSRSLNVTNIEWTNAQVPEGHEIRLISNALVVTIRGPQNLVDQVNAYNVRVVADLSEHDLQPNQTLSIPAAVSVDGFQTVGAVGEYNVALEIVPEGSQ